MSDLAAGPVVRTRSGAVSGVVVDGAYAFLGIPYAADPVAGRRFAAPAPHPGWTGTLSADRPGPAAPQAPSRLATVMGTPTPTGVAEAGCLTVNVWVPSSASPGDRLPVLFWLHGGAWVTGCSGWDWYSGARLAADHGIVVVTANSRLGALGYLHSTDLGPDNIGLLDQMAALRWTADDVAAFGGDPGLVTAGGQSAGGYAAALLAGADRTRGLVRRALLQSVPFGDRLRSPAEADEIARRLLDILHVTGAEQLRGLRPEVLVQAAGELARRGGLRPTVPALPFGPICLDDVAWPDPRDALLAAREDLDVLLGYTAEEGHAFLYGTPVADAPEPTVRTALDRLSVGGSGGAALAEHYRAMRADAPAWMLLGDAVTDQMFRAPAVALARNLAARGRPPRVYQFDWSAGIGAVHCVDLPFLFGTLGCWDDAPMLGPVRQPGRPELEPLARQFGGAVGAFVRSGDPVHAGLPDWPTYTSARPAVVRFDTLTTVSDTDVPAPAALA